MRAQFSFYAYPSLPSHTQRGLPLHPEQRANFPRHLLAINSSQSIHDDVQ
jgi:hypothetical protein